MRSIILTVLVLLGTVGWVGGCALDKGHDREKKALNIPKETPKRPQGSPALTVKPGGAEPFSKQDVVDYFKTHNLPRNATSTSDFTVESLEFLTNKDVTTRLNGASPGLAENDKIGFATLRGVFIFTGPPQATPARFSRAYAAFDAASGNLLMIGTLERDDQPR